MASPCSCGFNTSSLVPDNSYRQPERRLSLEQRGQIILRLSCRMSVCKSSSAAGPRIPPARVGKSARWIGAEDCIEDCVCRANADRLGHSPSHKPSHKVCFIPAPGTDACAHFSEDAERGDECQPALSPLMIKRDAEAFASERRCHQHGRSTHTCG